MNIEQIKENRYTPQKTKRGASSSKTDRTESRSRASGTGSTQRATNLSLSGSQFDSEITFAKEMFSNIQQESLDSLKEIKQKINDGAYNSEEVHRKMSPLIKNDLSTLTHILLHSSDTRNTPPALSDEHKKRLLEGPDVIKKVSENIAKDIENL
jgi:anti-sigma28 factor (negative regulator of flagellin synthesis)